MAEVREITKDWVAPDEDHVLIEPTPSGKFTANGSKALADELIAYTPPAFETREEAIASAQKWADEKNVPKIYVRKLD